MSEPTAAADDELPPKDVMQRFEALAKAMQEGRCVLVRLRTKEGGKFHYVAAAVGDDKVAAPVAVFPEGVSMFAFLDAVGTLTLTAKDDPEFKGVRQ